MNEIYSAIIIGDLISDLNCDEAMEVHLYIVFCDLLILPISQLVY